MPVETCPWIVDRHNHVSLYAALQDCVDLSAHEPGAARAVLEGLPEDRLTTVTGWHSGKVPLGDHELARLPPAVIVNYSLHGLLLTWSAGAMLRDQEPELVERHREPAWSEQHLPRLLSFVGRSAGLDAEKLARFMRRLEALGVGAADDLLLTGEDAWRVAQASPWSTRLRFWTTPDVFRTLSPEARAAAAGIKLFVDGALGARTAALSGPYRGGGQGVLTWTGERLHEALAEAHPLAKPVAIHAIGDVAIDRALAALEDLDRAGLRFPAVRLEHVQFITEPQGWRARDLGVVLSMQPSFSSDSALYADRLEPRWLEANNPFRMLVDRCGFAPGKDLVLGSDGMPHGLAEAVRNALFPPYPGQRLELAELLAGHGHHPDARGTATLEIDRARRSARVVASG
jgi:hypothetical protein